MRHRPGPGLRELVACEKNSYQQAATARVRVRGLWLVRGVGSHDRQALLGELRAREGGEGG